MFDYLLPCTVLPSSPSRPPLCCYDVLLVYISLYYLLFIFYFLSLLLFIYMYPLYISLTFHLFMLLLLVLGKGGGKADGRKNAKNAHNIASDGMRKPIKNRSGIFKQVGF